MKQSVFRDALRQDMMSICKRGSALSAKTIVLSAKSRSAQVVEKDSSCMKGIVYKSVPALTTKTPLPQSRSVGHAYPLALPVPPRMIA